MPHRQPGILGTAWIISKYRAWNIFSQHHISASAVLVSEHLLILPTSQMRKPRLRVASQGHPVTKEKVGRHLSELQTSNTKHPSEA